MIEITDNLIAVVSAQLEDIDDIQVTRVLTALNFIYDGPAVGTVMHNAETGEVAQRISENGVITWRVAAPNGEVWGTHEATLTGTWTTLFEPPPPAAEEPSPEPSPEP